MKKVRIADLKARLSEHLRTVRKGGSLTVLDRDTPVARIVPYATEGLEVRQATRRPAEIDFGPRRTSSKAGPAPTDSLAALLEDRRRR
jgi:prevent-host-death family protein